MEHKISKVIFSIMLLSAAVMATGSVMAQKVYRWVDENGEVHYTQSLPPDFQDKKHDVLDERGIVREEDKSLVPAPPPPKPRKEDDPMELPRDSSGMERPKALYSEKEMQEKMDRFLMLRYDSEQEIVDAMTVEINQLEYDRRLLQKSRDSMYEAYRGQIKQAANRQRSGTEVDSEAIASIMGLQARLESNENSLDGLKAREEDITKVFNSELERYRHLVEKWSEDA
jgi:hypothetical protein